MADDEFVEPHVLAEYQLEAKLGKGVSEEHRLSDEIFDDSLTD